MSLEHIETNESTLNDEQKKRRQEVRKNYYDRYIKYLISNGADPEIIECPTIKAIMYYVIDNADQVNLAEGRTPFNYPDVREDGTFDIRGRTSGHTTSEIYRIKRSEKPEEYLEVDVYFRDSNFVDILHVAKDGKSITIEKIPKEDFEEKDIMSINTK